MEILRKLAGRETLLVGVLLLVSLGVRVVGLGLPNQVVFDEVHFGKFVTAYCCTGQRFFDIHPPHAKLLIAGAAKLAGYRGGVDFARIGASYGEVSSVSLRLVPALAGSLLPLIMYGLLRRSQVGMVGAALGGVALALDNALILQSRVIALDSVLLIGIFGAIWLALLAATSRHGEALAFLAGGLAGLAAGSKFTGLVGLAVTGIIITFNRRWRQGWLLLLGFGLVYLGGWAWHFVLLDQPGSGDAWHISTFGRGIEVPVKFGQELVTWHRLMLAANYNLTADHPDASPWWSWPLMLRPVFYWQDSGRALYLIGNPVVWWGSAGLVMVAAAWAVVKRQRGLLWAWLGLGLALLPLMRVPRALFIYHYFTVLIFAVLLSASWLDKRWVARKPIAIVGLVLLIVGGWWLTGPLTYGMKTPEAWQMILSRLPRF
jgi:dolichyl-phosphate-mannose-protein mannosyltransferase